MVGVSRSENGDERPPERFDDYAADRTDARFTDWCRERSEPDWTAAVDHRFTEQLRADTLDDAVFERYLVQDYAFLDALVGAFGHALGDAPSMAAKGRLAEFLGTLTDEENDYFVRAFDALGVEETDRTGPDLTPTTRALQDLLGRVAHEGGYAETLAVLVPAEWIYRSWAADPPARPERFYLAEWIDLHDNPDFDAFVTWLRAELDREGTAASPARQRRLERLFARTVELEAAFFESAYATGHEAGDQQGGAGQW